MKTLLLYLVHVLSIIMRAISNVCENELFFLLRSSILLLSGSVLCKTCDVMLNFRALLWRARGYMFFSLTLVDVT